MKHTVVGIDIAKRVFQLQWVDEHSGEILRVQLKRTKFLEHFASREPCLIGMEACGGSEHEVKLISARIIKPLVGGKQMALPMRGPSGPRCNNRA